VNDSCAEASENGAANDLAESAYAGVNGYVILPFSPATWRASVPFRRKISLMALPSKTNGIDHFLPASIPFRSMIRLKAEGE
jgi:hypothetical protein